MKLSEQDRIRVGEAVTRAEANSDGEIVTVVSNFSDAYHDAVLHWALLVAFLVLCVVASAPVFFTGLLDRVTGGWLIWTPRELMTALLALVLVKFLVARWIFGLKAIRFALVPASTKARRVRRRALLLFRLATENRTRARTGVLLYLASPNIARRSSPTPRSTPRSRPRHGARRWPSCSRPCATGGRATAWWHRSRRSGTSWPSISPARPTTATNSRTA